MTDRPRRLSLPKSQNHIFSPLTPTAVVCRLLCQVSCAFHSPNVGEWNFICVFPNLLKGWKNFPAKMLRTIHRPHSQKRFPIFCCQKKIAGTFYLYWPRSQICLQGLYNMQYPLPIFQFLQHHKQNSINLQCCHTDHFLLTTERKRELAVFFLVIYVN